MTATCTALLDLLCSGHPANVGAAAGADSGVPSLGKDLVGLVGSAMHWLGAKMEFAAHAALSNTKEGSKKNIEYHYDAGNAFYRLFLDDTMLYSSGIHQPLDAGPCTVGSALGHIPEDDFEAREKHLEEAQYAKIDAMLEVSISNRTITSSRSCGWGACAIRAARRAPGIESPVSPSATNSSRRPRRASKPPVWRIASTSSARVPSRRRRGVR